MKTEKESMRSTLDSILAKVNMVAMMVMTMVKMVVMTKVNMVGMMMGDHNHDDEEKTGKNKNYNHVEMSTLKGACDEGEHREGEGDDGELDGEGGEAGR